MEAISQDSSAYADFSPLGVKVCSVCKVSKRMSEFPASRTTKYKGGVSCRCKECNRARWKLYRANNLQKVKDMQRKWDTELLHYGVDEKFGDTWRDLSAALSLWGNMSDWAGWDDVSFTGQGSCHSIASDAPYDVVEELRCVVGEVTGYSAPKQAMGFDLKAR